MMSLNHFVYVYIFVGILYLQWPIATYVLQICCALKMYLDWVHLGRPTTCTYQLDLISQNNLFVSSPRLLQLYRMYVKLFHNSTVYNVVITFLRA